MTVLVRAFASIFLRSPHRTTRNYKALLRGIGTDIFNKEHQLEPYYASAYAHYRLDFLFRNQILPPELKPARYHLLLAYSLLIDNMRPPSLNSHEVKRYCNTLMESLWDDDQFRVHFETAAEHIREVAKGNLHRDNIRTETFTNDLLEQLGAKE